MNEKQAIDLVQKTFKSAFDRNNYIHFLKNLLNEFDEEGARSNQGARIPDKFQNYVEKLERVGKYLVDEHEVMLFIVYLKNTTSIERARTMQRNFVASYLQKDMKDAALVAFVSKDPADWRFSFIKMEYRYDEQENKIKEEFTPAKRWSFLVGANEASHTAQRKLVPLMADDDHNPTLAELEEAFNIEKVTKEFFEKYRALFMRTKEALDKAIEAEPATRADFEARGIDTVNLAKKLLGQIIFLYYLQKKGWFGVAKNAKWGNGSRNFLRELFDKKHATYENFFNDILEPLFYDALRIDRSHDDHYYSRFNCKIPFLNGGLFDPMNNYDWVNTDILLSNELFHNKTKTKEGDEGDGILDIFDRYNFTVKEDEPFEKEVAIDPELLGKAYEKFNAIRPDNYAEFVQALKSGKKGDESKFNKQYGVYYTPREIVHYMCQQSLINYLYSELNVIASERSSASEAISNDEEIASGRESAALRNDISKEDIATLILRGEQIKENDERVVAEGRETETYSFLMPESIRNRAALIDEKLATIKVCDPAVGSGAFPVGMMSEIVRARDVLKNYLNTKDTKGTKEEQGKSIYDFKRGCIENSLYGVDIDSGAVEIAKLRLWLSLIVDEDDIQNIKPLPNLDYKIVCGNSLLGVEKSLFNHQLFVELETLKPIYSNETNPTKKQYLKKKIDGLINQVTNGHTEFYFEIYFSEVFHEKQGFDLIIGNPPYLGNNHNKEIFRPLAARPWGAQYYVRKMDLLYFFFHLALDLASPRASICLITTNYWITADSAIKLRLDLKNRSTLIQLINFDELKLFSSAPGQHNIITQTIKGKSKIQARVVLTKRTGSATAEMLHSILEGKDNETTYQHFEQDELFFGTENYIRFTPITSKSSASGQKSTLDFQKIDDVSFPLSAYTKYVVKGVESGCDIVTNQLIDAALQKKLITKSEAGKYEIGAGIYVLSEQELRNLKLNKSELQDCIKPFFKNSEIQKYYTHSPSEKSILYVDSQTEIDRYPNIKAHLMKFRPLLAAREQSVTEENNWFWIRGSKRASLFYRVDAIVVPYRATSNRFSICHQDIFGASDVYYVVAKNNFSSRALLGYLNSSFIYYHLFQRGKRKGKVVEYFKNPIEHIPVHKKFFTDNKDVNSIESLVDKIIKAKRDNPRADISKLEKEIDELIYQLYGLTDEEKDIVEGK